MRKEANFYHDNRHTRVLSQGQELVSNKKTFIQDRKEKEPIKHTITLPTARLFKLLVIAISSRKSRTGLSKDRYQYARGFIAGEEIFLRPKNFRYVS